MDSSLESQVELTDIKNFSMNKSRRRHNKNYNNSSVRNLSSPQSNISSNSSISSPGSNQVNASVTSNPPPGFESNLAERLNKGPINYWTQPATISQNLQKSRNGSGSKNYYQNNSNWTTQNNTSQAYFRTKNKAFVPPSTSILQAKETMEIKGYDDKKRNVVHEFLNNQMTEVKKRFGVSNERRQEEWKTNGRRIGTHRYFDKEPNMAADMPHMKTFKPVDITSIKVDLMMKRSDSKN